MSEEMTEPRELLVRRQVEPMIGFKEVTLKLKSSEFTISGMRDAYSGVLQRAECKKYPKAETEHDAPLLSCTCGFYAYSSMTHLEWKRPLVIVATVEMFGTVIVHEKGYRASNQRVTSLSVGRSCWICLHFNDQRRRADALYFTSAGEMKTLCVDHGSLSERLNATMRVDLAHLAAELDIAVGWS